MLYMTKYSRDVVLLLFIVLICVLLLFALGPPLSTFGAIIAANVIFAIVLWLSAKIYQRLFLTSKRGK